MGKHEKCKYLILEIREDAKNILRGGDQNRSPDELNPLVLSPTYYTDYTPPESIIEQWAVSKLNVKTVKNCKNYKFVNFEDFEIFDVISLLVNYVIGFTKRRVQK